MTVESASLVHVDGASKSYGVGDSRTTVLSGAQLTLARGETTSLIGVSGSGKSTLISLMAGLMVPDAGRVLVDGQDLAGLDESARARLRARRIGIVLQSGNLIPFLTERENVELAIDLAGGRHATARAKELLGGLGLGRRLDHHSRRLSGGEAQRVSLAVAMANEPDLLLADEVAGELDESTAADVMDVIFAAWRSRGLTVLYVTHSAELAARAQHRLHLRDGLVTTK